ncbi:hypothetical protein BZG36_02466 [Bifiguratus adelaidae]|uniref:Exportin-7/Ran-binding protein 17 TPR repeats domain-containing protein n=1 Tax=Bifiguratus adelaidae TaxID=1938954 RepID=A0A261Y0U9_9FUNG|nr:hypothetical protein BZG36_02466 [Bifiguratus adelaidae]
MGTPSAQQLLEYGQTLAPDIRRDFRLVLQCVVLTAANRPDSIGPLVRLYFEQEKPKHGDDDKLVIAIREALLKSWPLCGFPRVLNGMKAAMEALDEDLKFRLPTQPSPARLNHTKEKLESDLERGKAFFDQIYSRHSNTVTDNIHGWCPDLVPMIQQYGYGSILSDFAVLGPQETELAVVCALIPMSVPSQQGDFDLQESLNIVTRLQAMNQADRKFEALQKLTEQYYNAADAQSRQQASDILEYAFPGFDSSSAARLTAQKSVGSAPHGFPYEVNIFTPAETLYSLQVFLENSPSPYAQMFAISRMKSIVADHFGVLGSEYRLVLRNFIIQYAGQHPGLQPFIIAQLSQLFTLVTKLGWFDSIEFRNTIEELQMFLQASVDHKIVGLQMFATLVQEIYQPNPPRNLARQRKVAVSFRDDQLLDILQAGITMLGQLLSQQIGFENSAQESRLREATLLLLRNCLTFDFNGTTPDESGDDVGSIQVPGAWKRVFEDGVLTKALFSAYAQFPSPHSARAMECLVQVASVRRSLFNEEERSIFITSIMQEIRSILLASTGMHDSENYHEFCRMLSRFRSTYSLLEISEKQEYEEWIQLLADFTIKGFRAWQWAPHSVQYLLTFWSKMVSSLSHSRTASAPKLEAITVQLTRAYAESRIDSVPSTMEQGPDDPLENEDALVESLDMLTNVARCQYDESSRTIISLFDPLAVLYTDLTQRVGSTGLDDAAKQQLAIIEHKFAWLVYIIGSFVGGRTAYLSSEDLDSVDGDLTAKALQLMNANEVFTSRNGTQWGSEKLDSAFLYLFQQFKKSYVGESAQRTSAVYSKLSENVGVNDQSTMLTLIMQKILSNLSMWGNNSAIILKSLRLLNDLASGYSSVKQLRKLDTTNTLLQNHTSKQFAFLDGVNHLRARMIYYNALSRILFCEDAVEKEFEEFVKPFDDIFARLATLDNVASYRQEEVMRTIQGLFRDLRGFIGPISSRKTYMLFFEWFFPSKVSFIFNALEAYQAQPISITILKFWAEFIHSRSQRLTFDISSPNGILLFRDTSKVLVTYALHVLSQPEVEPSARYVSRYKGISVCYASMMRSLAGRYVNFGVFALYNDPALEEALGAIFRMTLSIPVEDMLAFPKLAQAFFTFLDVFTNEHMMALPDLNSDVFLYLMRACSEGVKSSDVSICSEACSSIDHICCWVVNQSEKKNHPNHWLLNYFKQYTDILPFLFSTVFNTVLFEDKAIQWSLSRPLLALILLNQDRLMSYFQSIIDIQLPERRELLSKALNNLMEDIEMSISSRNRDRFTQNLAAFRRDMVTAGVNLIPPTANYDGMMT